MGKVAQNPEPFKTFFHYRLRQDLHPAPNHRKLLTMGKSSASYKPRKPRKPGVLEHAQELAEAGASLHQAAAQTKLPVSTLKSRSRNDRWALPSVVRSSAERLSQFHIHNVGVPCWEMGGNLGAATRETLRAARLPVFPCPDAIIDKLIKGKITMDELYKQLKPNIEAVLFAQNHKPDEPVAQASDTEEHPDEQTIPLFEGESTRLTITFPQPAPKSTPVIDSPPKPPRTWSNGKPRQKPGPKEMGRELSTDALEISAWEREREPIRQALAQELQRVATFFPSCKTIADVKAALQIHRDLHGKLEQSAGQTNVTIHLGALKTVPREKFVRGRVADATPRRNAC